MSGKIVAAYLISFGAFLIPLLVSQSLDLDSCGLACFLLYLLIPAAAAATAASKLFELSVTTASLSILAGWASAFAVNQTFSTFSIPASSIYLSIQYLAALILAVGTAVIFSREKVEEGLKVEEAGEHEAEVESVAEEGGEEFIICPHCGREIPADSIYCPLCGKRIKEEE
ncbi:MAG: zinc ribbon domain-containing protein [Thaumarchaeota archaeon]|nr:zinc ribbon domain-containing protein [Nitrososphaerota archaeon]